MHTSRVRALGAALLVALASACTDAPTAPQPGDSAAPLLAGERANLLECPVNTTVSTVDVVGPLGGLLRLGGFEVSIPASAVPTPTAFALTVPAGRLMKVDVTAVGLEHYLFAAPVSVTIDYSRCPEGRTAGRKLSVWYVAPITNAPLENMGGVDDPVNRRITFTTDHFSSYVIAY